MKRKPADFRNASKTVGWANWAVHVVRPALARIYDRYQAHRRARNPEELDDRMLADIGLTRNQIEYGARARPLPDRFPL